MLSRTPVQRVAIFFSLHITACCLSLTLSLSSLKTFIDMDCEYVICNGDHPSTKGLRVGKEEAKRIDIACSMSLYNAAELSRSKDKGDQDWIGR